MSVALKRVIVCGVLGVVCIIVLPLTPLSVPAHFGFIDGRPGKPMPSSRRVKVRPSYNLEECLTSRWIVSQGQLDAFLEEANAWHHFGVSTWIEDEWPQALTELADAGIDFTSEALFVHYDCATEGCGLTFDMPRLDGGTVLMTATRAVQDPHKLYPCVMLRHLSALVFPMRGVDELVATIDGREVYRSELEDVRADDGRGAERPYRNCIPLDDRACRRMEYHRPIVIRDQCDLEAFLDDAGSYTDIWNMLPHELELFGGLGDGTQLVIPVGLPCFHTTYFEHPTRSNDRLRFRVDTRHDSARYHPDDRARRTTWTHPVILSSDIDSIVMTCVDGEDHLYDIRRGYASAREDMTIMRPR